MRIVITALFGILACGVSYASEVPVGDYEIVLKTLAMEAGSEGVEGMSYVALTLHNRALKRNTDLSTEALRPMQYSCWNKDRRGVRSWSRAWIARFYTEKQRGEAEKALEMGLKMALNPEYQGIRHYHTESVKPSWSIGKAPFRKVGSHLFYKGIK